MGMKLGQNLKVSLPNLIMLLLSEAGGYLESETRIHKLTFLGSKEHDIQTPASFWWSHWGPLSSDVNKALKDLHEDGLIQIRKDTRKTAFGDEYIVNTYTITEKGNQVAIELREKSSSDLRSAIGALYERFGKIALSQLLNYVHTVYSADNL